MAQEFTITIFCENEQGLLARIVSIITRRHYDILSLTASKSSMKHVYRFTIVMNLELEQVEKLCKQIEKQVDVLKAFYYTDDQIVHQEIALYKIPINAFFNGKDIEQLIRKHFARVLLIEKDYIVIEKTGSQKETEELLNELRDVGIYEFVRSGRIAIVKPMEMLNNYLKEIEQEFITEN